MRDGTLYAYARLEQPLAIILIVIPSLMTPTFPPLPISPSASYPPPFHLPHVLFPIIYPHIYLIWFSVRGLGLAELANWNLRIGRAVRSVHDKELLGEERDAEGGG